MNKYMISVKGDNKEFQPFESFYQFSKKNIGETIFASSKEGKIYSLEIIDMNHEVKQGHVIKLICNYKKLFS